MQARIREYCASKVYLRDFTIREEDQDLVLEHALDYRRIAIRTHGNTTLLESAYAAFRSTDLITWRDVDRGGTFTTDEMLHKHIIRDGVYVSEETAKIIANMGPVTPYWISSGRWEANGSRAVYNINGCLIIAKFRPIVMSRSGAFCKWDEYERFFVNFNPAPTIDMLIDKLVAERDQLRKHYPEIAQYGFPSIFMSDIASNRPTDKVWGEINAILGAVRIINAALPQPIAEEIVENCSAEFIAR